MNEVAGLIGFQCQSKYIDYQNMPHTASPRSKTIECVVNLTINIQPTVVPVMRDAFVCSPVAWRHHNTHQVVVYCLWIRPPWLYAVSGEGGVATPGRGLRVVDEMFSTS